MQTLNWKLTMPSCLQRLYSLWLIHKEEIKEENSGASSTQWPRDLVTSVTKSFFSMALLSSGEQHATSVSL